MRTLAVVILLLGAVLAGCSDARHAAAPTAPPLSSYTATPPAGGVWRWGNGDTLYYTYNVSRYDPKLQHVQIGTATVIYICDYPLGFIGPPAPGHCYTDGTGCTGFDTGGSSWTTKGISATPNPTGGWNVQTVGDPTADD